jgi:hypothetical protein
MSIGVAWAGSGLVPVRSEDLTGGTEDPNAADASPSEDGDASGSSAMQFDLESGQILAGAAKVSLEPRPEDMTEAFPEARWETDYNKCANLSENQEGVQEGLMHVADFRVRWAENPNCIFMGGYGIGPMNPIVSWDDEYGLWARSIAMSDGTDTVVLTLIDAVYWEAHYSSLCDGCGFIDLAETLSQELGVPPESFIFASTHSHTSPDFIGGWGAVPDWYMQQATDSLKAAVTQAIASMQPAVLEAGETLARQFNGERRDFYRSAEDDGLSWFRLVDADNRPRPEVCITPPAPTPSEPNNGNGNGFGNQGKDEPPTAPSPLCEPPAPGRAIATVGAYAAHPVTADESSGRADADFPGVFAARVEESFGGVGMFLQTGLGNMSPRGNKEEMGSGLAGLVPAIGSGKQIGDTDIRVGRTFWDQPSTNIPLGSLGVAGFFDRTFSQNPAVVNEGKSGADNKKCKSASPVSVNTSVSAVKVGGLWITGGPGELFANITNTIEERNPNGVTLALGLVNDGLGYIVQNFETDHVGRQGVGFVGDVEGQVGLAEYEDAYSIDHCFGDAVLEKTIALLGTL